MREQLDRILASAAFAGADRASGFLRFVIERTLDGCVSEIKESVIGVEVLGRSPSFDPKTDPIVRVEAGRLRARLGAYYQSEGRGDSVLIALPKGGYVPEFSERPLPAAPKRVTHPAILLAAGALLGIALTTVVLSYFRRAPNSDVMRLFLLPPPHALIQQSAISPDGRNVAFSATSEGKLQLWVRPLDSLEARALPGAEEAAYPFWSPDSRSLGFVAMTTLKRIEFSGGPAQTLCNVGPFRGATWGSAGVIVYAPHPRGVLYQIPAGGGPPKPVSALDPVRGETPMNFRNSFPTAGISCTLRSAHTRASPRSASALSIR